MICIEEVCLELPEHTVDRHGDTTYGNVGALSPKAVHCALARQGSAQSTQMEGNDEEDEEHFLTTQTCSEHVKEAAVVEPALIALIINATVAAIEHCIVSAPKVGASR